MHQIGFVKHVTIQLALIRILHQDLRGLAQAGQQLMRRLRREDHRLFTTRTIRTDRMIIAIEVVEGRMRQPGFIKVQRIDFSIEHLFDLFNVIENAVVGRLGDRQQAWLGALVGDEGVGGDLLLDAFPGKLALRNRADDAEVVARGHQEDRDRATHDNRVKHRLMAVTVNDDNVTRRDRRVPDNLVGCRRTVRHKVQVVTIEDTCRITLRSRDRTRVVEELAEFFDRITDVGTQHVFTKELVEHLADRAFQKCDTA